MSAPILRPGDAVHIMVPVRPTGMPKGEFIEASNAAGTEYTKIFARHGVYVDSWSGSDQVSEVKVVAIFRKEAS